MRWGADRAGEGRLPRTHRHVACDSELLPGGMCPACGVVVPLDEVETEVPGPPTRPDDPVAEALRAPRRLLTPLG